MNVDDREARLNDYLDGVLDPEEVRAVEEELARDPEFRALEQALRRVVHEAATLLKGVAPERDLWPDIDARLGRPDAESAERRAAPGIKYALLAASFAAVFLAGIFFAQHQGAELPPNQSPAAFDSAMKSPELAIVEAEYGQARDLLVQALDESRDRLAPETISVVDENLAIIGNAVAEIRSALKQDPGNQQLIRSLVAAYDREVDLLQQATQLTAQL